MVESSKNDKDRARNGVSDSLIRIELITHFHRNPGLEGTSRELAAMIGRDRSRVESQVIKLVRLHILEERSREGELRYKYVKPRYASAAAEKHPRRQSERIESSVEGRESAAGNR